MLPPQSAPRSWGESKTYHSSYPAHCPVVTPSIRPSFDKAILGLYAISFRLCQPEPFSSSVRTMGPLSSEVTATYLPVRHGGHDSSSVATSTCFVTNHRYEPWEPVNFIGSRWFIYWFLGTKSIPRQIALGPGERC